MTQQTISAPGFEIERRRDGETGAHRRRFELIGVLLSVCAHLVAALLVALLPGFLPTDARPKEQGTVEFVLLEQKGAEPSKAGQPLDSKPMPPQKVEAPQPDSRKNETRTPPSRAAAAPAVANPNEEPVPPPIEQIHLEVTKSDAQPAAHEQETRSVTPHRQEPPIVNLRDATGEFDAIFSGDHIIPAALDGRFRNRPPAYPAEAAMKAQHGLVLVVIHVGANGLVTGVDVSERSGVAALDQAAVAAARRWRFHPAMKEGRTVPFDLPFTFIFEDD